MSNPYFNFKQFTVRQDRTAMKVGTDGVLLGAWANISGSVRILDIGTGTGLIALMTAQRNIHARIDAIEISSEACGQAKENFEASLWHERLHIFNCSLQEYSSEDTYDTIICNPPFFIHSTQTPDTNRTTARHCEQLTHPELLEHAARLLTITGSFSVILPTTEATAFVKEAREHKLYVSRITHVLPNPEKPAKRWLMEFTKTERNTVTDKLVTELERHKYSEAYILLTKDFYLNL